MESFENVDWRASRPKLEHEELQNMLLVNLTLGNPSAVLNSQAFQLVQDGFNAQINGGENLTS
ncbi:hypothetical protein V5O48_019590, partial [Marasmius crinis-equi]